MESFNGIDFRQFHNEQPMWNDFPYLALSIKQFYEFDHFDSHGYRILLQRFQRFDSDQGYAALATSFLTISVFERFAILAISVLATASVARSKVPKAVRVI